MENEIRLGVIGLGRGRHLFTWCGELPGVRLAAVCDADPAARERAHADFPSVAVFADHERMLDAGLVDAVLVETPPHVHAACAVAALERNVHVLSDCPAVHDLAEAEPLWRAAQASRAVYMFGENCNYWAFVETGLDLKRKGLLGEPFYLEAEYVHDLGDLVVRTPWRKGYEPIRYCTHSLGPVLKWLDEDLVSVSCFDTGSHVQNDPRDHDAMVALFRTRSDVVVKVLTTFINCHPKCYHRFVYHGTKGYFERTSPVGNGPDSQLTLFHTREVYGIHGGKLVELPVGEPRPEAGHGGGGHGGADVAMLRDFIATVREGRPSPIDVRQALRMTLPGLYALESARRGGELTEIRYPWSE